MFASPEIYFFISSIVTALIYYLKYKFNYWKLRDVPHEKPEFPYGNLKGIGKKLHQFEIQQRIYEKFKNHSSPIAGMLYYFQPVVLCTHLDFIKSVFATDSAHFIDRGSYYNEQDSPLSAHLFNLDNPKWKLLRTKLTPTFTSGKIKMMFHTVSDVADKLVNKLAIESESAVDHQLEMKEICTRFTTDVIGKFEF
jgi:cytochrome P450 family 6